MVRHSLIFKLYLYTVGALILTFAFAFSTSHALMDRARGEIAQQFGYDFAQFIGHEIESSMQGDRPSAERMDQLSKAFHADLDFQSWGSGQPGLLQEKIVVQSGLWPRRGGNFSVRIDDGSKPRGVLSVSLHPPIRRPPRPMVPFAGAFMLVFGLLLLPPFFFWVIRPLKGMGAIAQRLGEGDLETPIPSSRRDEFGDLERAFEAMRMRLRQMLHQKERLLIDISHELRGPLSRMAIALPLLQIEGNTRYVSSVERDMKTMDKLIGELLTLSRAQGPLPPSREDVDLAHLAKELVDERSLAFQQKNLRLDCAFGQTSMQGDRALLARALGNLLDNAIKYAPECGRIRLEAGSKEGSVFFRTINDGPGIAAEDLPHVFEPFYRPDASRSRETGGTGLGLAIVKAIADAHGGKATLESVAGESTTIELSFPRQTC